MQGKGFTVFVVEDDEWYRQLVIHNAELNPDITAEGFASGDELLKNLHRKPDVVTLDYRLPDIMGNDLLKRILEQNPETRVIVISEQNDIEVAVELLQSGAYDYLVKSNDIRNRLFNALNNILKTRQLENRVEELQSQIEKKYDFHSSMVGNSPVLQPVFDLMAKASRTNINVSITGETGTGKELVAKAIHFNSDRKAKPLVTVNISALPRDLMESELFGHEKGSFTGSTGKRKGRFEEANGGTLFMDEIAEMELPMQAKLLRVLQEREFTPVGSNQVIKTDFRLVVATHKNLAEEVKAGRFREDLFYRIIGLTIELPPLRARGHDILLLAKHFIEAFCKENSMPVKKVSPEAGQKLLGYVYPGNVRELKSTVETAVALSDGDQIQPSDLVFHSGDTVTTELYKEMTMREYEHLIIQNLLNRYQRDIPKVAEILDISPATIYRILKEFRQD